MNFLESITWAGLPAQQYIREETEKTQIYIHHTAGGPDPFSVVNWWQSTPARVATHFIIAGKPFRNSHSFHDGQIVQCYNTKFWAWHLGLKSRHLNVARNPKTSRELNAGAITVELCNWGPLRYDREDSRFETLEHDYPVERSEVHGYSHGYRGHNYYQKYTDAQLTSLRNVLRYLCEHWNIPTEFKGTQMFDIDARALEGDPGIWTHTTVRPDKYDCHPQPELIEILQTL